ncbi:uncharacterized protein LOC122384648 [Amphibalanus amphitrite]|uniref:uncharacterized protein LOC122384648 n=1 Tax=Amphibalanus amphitrite TaxID=1232801 RepID=UPI001C928C36|nr:uncharacterized protein LOC122384648 [Amphibalanus amphitrite]
MTGSGTGGGRLLDDSSDQPTGLALVGRIAALALTPGDLPCVQRDLCQLVREGHRAGRPHDTTLPLASLPLSWLISKRTGHRFSDLCWVIPEAMRADDCHRLYPDCRRDQHS